MQEIFGRMKKKQYFCTVNIMALYNYDLNINNMVTNNKSNSLIAPRPSTENGCKAGEARTTVILNKELVKKVKYIALAEDTSIKD